MMLMAKGLRQKQVAEQLSITPETAKKHLRNAYKKLGAHNKVDALRKAGIW
jgi:DNA-binding CsgD family transcriptional regulator